MKKAISILIIAVIILTVSTATACGGGLSGKYVCDVHTYYGSSDYIGYEFKNGKVYNMYDEVGNYKISGNKLIMRFTFMGMTDEYEFTLSKDKNSFSDGTTYNSTGAYFKEGTT